jgi:hypothetical protein
LHAPVDPAEAESLRSAFKVGGGLETLLSAVQQDVQGDDFTLNKEDMFLTKTNHKQHIPKPSKQIKREVYLPEVITKYAYNTCALVGNSGGLLTASHGQTIDTHDAVMRINQAPTYPYPIYVGRKTTFRLLNKKWVAVYADKEQGREALLPVEEKNATLILTRASNWQVERLAGVIRRQRPDLQVLVLTDEVLTRLRQILTRFRAAAQGVVPPEAYGKGTSPSSAMLGLFVLMQFCKTVSVYGVGGPYTTWELHTRNQSSEVETETSPLLASSFKQYNVGRFQSSASRAYKRPACEDGANLRPANARYRLIKGFPYPYHYFVRWFDSFKLAMHPAHSFDLESDFLYSLQAAAPDQITFCPPADPCLGAATTDPCNLEEYREKQASESLRMQYQALSVPLMPWMLKYYGKTFVPNPEAEAGAHSDVDSSSAAD